jgi:phenylalanine-4-hydroxylase
MLIQEYNQYTPQDHNTWSILFTRQIEKIKTVAYKNFGIGLRELNFQKDHIPEFVAVNKNLKEITGWQIYAVPGLIDNAFFFQQMSTKQFGATTWIRKPEQLDYLEEPDMFHDVFGHIPLLTDPNICEFLFGLAKIAMKNLDSEEVIEALARLYWYTIEFGLVKENDELKIYGAGILSSIGETDYCLSAKATRVPFNLETILSTPYIKDKYQEQYFVLESMEQLRDIHYQLEQKFALVSEFIPTKEGHLGG